MFSFRSVEWSDRDALWDWWSEPLRHIAFGSTCEVRYDEHCAWLRKTISDLNIVLLVGRLDNLRIGLVRFDQASDGEYDVSAYLKPPYCGRRYVPGFLQEAGEFFRELKSVRKIRATINGTSPALVKQFLAAGYTVEESSPDKILLGLTVGE